MEEIGFIITRHVTNEQTNKYWNRAILCIRKFYPNNKIVVIDDNSCVSFVKPSVRLLNVIFIKSEFPGAGEILPYYYLLKYKLFKFAIIIHDSVFIHKQLPINAVFSKHEVMPLWHFEGDDSDRIIRDSLISHLKNSHTILTKANQSKVVLGLHKWHGCFGGQTMISLQFLKRIEDKYNITKLVTLITRRNQRMAFERIIGLIISIETNSSQKSLFGNIHKYQTFGYTYDNYITDFNKGSIPRYVVKVWTGR